MIKTKIIISALFILIIAGCSSTEFLGAKKWVSKRGYYVERWFLNPEKPVNVPEGTAFYGAAADKIKDKFIIKYYIAERDGDSTTEIPAKDMWKVRHNGKHYTEQDDDNLFFYTKNAEGLFFKQTAIPTDIKIPVKECYKNGWCKLYITNSNVNRIDEVLYVKKSILIAPTGRGPDQTK